MSEETETEESPQSSSAEAGVTLREVEWASEPNYDGREFTNTMLNPQAQIHVERERFAGNWQITLADNDGLIAVGERWEESVGKSLREAVQHAVEKVKTSAG